MLTVNDLRNSVLESTPVLAAIGATDFAVERLRAAVGTAAGLPATLEARFTRISSEVEKAVVGFDPKAAQARLQQRLEPGRLVASAQQVPAIAVAKAFEVAGRAEAGYADVAKRGGTLVRRITNQQATQDLISQGRSTVSKTKAATTTARRSADQTASAAGRTASAAGRTATSAGKPAGKPAGTARKRAAATRTSTRAAGTSARKTASKAAAATKAAAEKVGD